MKVQDLDPLESVNFDFKNRVFKINEIDIKNCTDVDISFHNRTWSVNIGVGACFDTNGEWKKRTATN